jgi:hypothetical protein
MLDDWQLGSPKIEENGGTLSVSVHDIDCKGGRRAASSDETQQAILYWIAEIHSRIGKPN